MSKKEDELCKLFLAVKGREKKSGEWISKKRNTTLEL